MTASMEEPASPSLERIEGSLLMPPEQWPGNCHGVALAVAKILRADGEKTACAVRGHWIGPCAAKLWNGEESPFAGRPFSQHTWVEIGAPSVSGEGVTVMDPTRFAFTGEAPCVYVCEEGRGKSYDQGGNATRQATRQAASTGWPERTEDSKIVFRDEDLWGGPDGMIDAMMRATPHPPPYTEQQIRWIANLHPRQFAGNHVAVYQWFAESDYKASVPLDNMDYYLPEREPS